MYVYVCVCVCHALFKVERAYLEGKQQNCLHTRLASARAAASPLVHAPPPPPPLPVPLLRAACPPALVPSRFALIGPNESFCYLMQPPAHCSMRSMQISSLLTQTQPQSLRLLTHTHNLIIIAGQFRQSFPKTNERH